MSAATKLTPEPEGPAALRLTEGALMGRVAEPGVGLRTEALLRAGAELQAAQAVERVAFDALDLAAFERAQRRARRAFELRGLAVRAGGKEGA